MNLAIEVMEIPNVIILNCLRERSYIFSVERWIRLVYLKMTSRPDIHNGSDSVLSPDSGHKGVVKKVRVRTPKESKYREHNGYESFTYQMVPRYTTYIWRI